jgi:hypothetical protein
VSDLVPVPLGGHAHLIYADASRSPRWDRLERLSDRLVDSIGSHSHSGLSDDRWYIPRDIESALLERLSQPAVQPQIVIGEAGHGKSTLVWSLHRALRKRGHRPVMVSATWLQRGEDGDRITSSEDIADAVLAQPKAVLLLDTADLLLHSETARIDVIDLLDQLYRAGVPVVATTRPQEGAFLPANVGQKIHLGPYSLDEELPSAIAALTDEFCAGDSSVPSDPQLAITTARARGLLVDDVCTSPLLLRLLFSLAAPQFPHLDYDVSELYSRFWERRVRADHRTGPHAPIDGGDDLTGTAGFLAIAMLALGTPEPHIDNLVRRASEAAEAAGHPIEERVLRADIRTLTGRGVLFAIDDHIRFFHQTFFEFAAAQGLTARGGEKELPRLIERIISAPDDLFVGAVVEQALIVLGTDSLAHSTVATQCQALLDTGHPHMVSIALTVWAHHPATVRFSVRELAFVPDDQLRRFLRTLPRVHSHTAAVAEHLAALWTTRPKLCTAITTTAASLVGRDPDAIAVLIRSTDMYAELVASHHLYVRSNSEPRTLLRLLVDTSPSLVRDSILTTIGGLADPSTGTDEDSSPNLGKQTIARYLHLAAELWTRLADTCFLDALADTISAVQSISGDSDADKVRDAFAMVAAADLAQQLSAAADPARFWLDWVDRLCTALERENGDRDPIVAAHLIALGMTIPQFQGPDHDDLISATYARMFALTGRTAPRQLARGCLTQILRDDSPARDKLQIILSTMLDGHLPAVHNNSALGDELWAAVTRQTIWDHSVPVEIVRRILEPSLRTYDGDDRLFTTGDHLVALAPAAIVWGESSAAAAAQALAHVDVRNKHDKQAANIFLDRATERAHQNPDRLVPLTVAIAHAVGRTATIKTLLTQNINHPAIDTTAPVLHTWLGDLLTGDDRKQRDGADLLRQLRKHDITTPTIGQLVSWLDRSTSPEGTANLLATISIHACRTGTTADAVDLFAQFVSTTSTPHPTVTAHQRSTQAVVIEAARNGLLECIVQQPDSFADQWTTVHVLTFAPRLHGAAIDIAGIRHLARFLRLEADAGHIDHALAHLDHTCTSLTALNPNLRVKASNKLKGAVAAIVRRARDHHYDALARLVRISPEQTSKATDSRPARLAAVRRTGP